MLKKLLALSLTLFAAIVLVACGPSADEVLQEAYDDLAVASGVIDDFDVPTKSGDVTIEWTASGRLSLGSVADDMQTIEVERTDLEGQGELVATLSYEDEEMTKTFTVVVTGELPAATAEDVNEFAKDLAVQGKTAEDLLLTVQSNEVQATVTWTSSDESVVSVGSASGYTATATVTRQDVNTSVKLVATVVGGETQVIREFWVQVYGNDVDLDGEYNVAFSDTEEGLNPINTNSAAASDIYTYLVDYLYGSDYDWQDAIEKGYADYPGDFSKVRTEDNPNGTVEMPSFVYIQTLAQAAAFPVSEKTGLDYSDGYGHVDIEESKNALDDTWTISIREDLVFEDGTPITSATFDYSWRQYLDPLQKNTRANYLYTGDYLPLVNGKAYFDQGDEATDALGFKLYEMGDQGSEVFAAREYSYSDDASANTGYDLYFAESGLYEDYYAEFWGAGYGATGWVLVDYDDNPFYLDADGNVIAPAAGYLDSEGNEIPTGTPAAYADIRPAYFTDNGEDAEVRYTRTTVDSEGNPDGGHKVLTPTVEWEDVGFDVVDDYTFTIRLTKEITQWDLMSTLGIVNLVHPENYENGKNEEGTVTTYGTPVNPLVSFGPYTLNWEDGQKFTFTRNETYYNSWDYAIKTINGPVIEGASSQATIINEFKAGNLDVAGVSGEYWEDFMDHPNLYISPSNSFYRLQFSLDRSNGTSGTDSSVLVKYEDFRTAIYLATDRDDFANTVLPPSQGALGFLSNIHQVTEDATEAYAASAVFRAQLEELGLSPNTGGYNSALAKQLFDQAYADAVAAGELTDGEVATIEFSYADSGSNPRIAAWVEAQYEEVFGDKLDVILVPMASAAFTAARDSGDFDLTFTGMSGATFQAMFGMYYIFSPTFSDFLAGQGFDIDNADVEVPIFYLYDLVLEKAAEDRTENEAAFLETLDDDGYFRGTFLELANLVADLESLYTAYDGQQADMTAITAGFERVLLEQMVAVPLFSSTSAAVYSDSVVRIPTAYHLFLGWGGITYMYIEAA